MSKSVALAAPPLPAATLDAQPPATLRAAYRDRIAIAAIVLLTGVALGPILRIVLYVSFHDGAFRIADPASCSWPACCSTSSA